MSRTPSRFSRTRAEAASPARIITDAIIAKLEQGVSPWRKPWTNAGAIERPLRACGLPYKGINVLYLWAIAEQRGYSRPTWMTYRQAQEFGAQVRKGESGTLAVFYKALSATDIDAVSGEETSSMRRVMRAYTVFNVDQIDNLPDRFAPVPVKTVVSDESHRADIDAFIAASGARIVHGGNQACYSPSRDLIELPSPPAFETYAHYGATAAHELSHWTGHPTRLDRDLNTRFGSDKYAAEELVAELASAFIGADLGLPVTHLDNHASYIDHWLGILKKDERALMTAAAKAEEAAGYLLAKAGRGTAVEDADSLTEDAPSPSPQPLDIAA